MSPAGDGYQAVILAAGRGSRMAEQTQEVPKALLPIGPHPGRQGEQTSFLRRQVELLHHLGVAEVVVVVGYLREMIQDSLDLWAPWVEVVTNPTPDISISGSLHSFQFAALAPVGLLDGRKQTLLMDADIVYHADVLRLLLEAPALSTLLVCRRSAPEDDEQVLVYGTPDRPRFLGKGLAPPLVDGAPCLGEATGIIKLAQPDHELVRQTINWMVGDPAAPRWSQRQRGFSSAGRGTEHEELTQHLMHLGRMRCVLFDVDLPFMEVDTAEEYRVLREVVYPRLLRMEQEENRR